MNSFFRLNRFIREHRGEDDDDACEVFCQGDLAEISIASKRCPYDAKGYCAMCNYGTCVENPPSIRDIRDRVKHILHDGKTKRVLFSTNGSFLGATCVPLSIQRFLLCEAASSQVETVIIEVHVDDVNVESLERVHSILRNKKIVLEIGVESASEVVREQCHLKPIKTERILEAIELCKRFSICTQLNMINGALFLDKKEVAADALHSIRWGLKHADYVCLFPANVKPYTVTMEAYKMDMYQPVSLRSVVALLDEFTNDELERVDVAWYGNRSIHYSKHVFADKTIMPRTCERCHDIMMYFFEHYSLTENKVKRKKLIQEVKAAEDECGCTCEEIRPRKWVESPQLNKRIITRRRMLLKKMALQRTDDTESMYA